MTEKYNVVLLADGEGEEEEEEEEEEKEDEVVTSPFIYITYHTFINLSCSAPEIKYCPLIPLLGM